MMLKRTLKKTLTAYYRELEYEESTEPENARYIGILECKALLDKLAYDFGFIIKNAVEDGQRKKLR